MKTILSAILPVLAFAFLLSCNQRKAQDPTPTSPTTPITETPTTTEPTEPAERAYQVVGFQKTACFGKCPVFQVKFFSDNTATWYGKMNVDRMGNYGAKLEGKVLKSIKDKAFELGYFDFYSEYPVKYKVADLPSTITYLRVGDMEKTIKDTFEGPEKLVEFEQFLEDVANKLDWQPAEQN